MISIELRWSIIWNGSDVQHSKDLELPFCPVPGMKYETHVGPGFVRIEDVVIKEDGTEVLVFLEPLHVDTEQEQDAICMELDVRQWD